MPDVTITKQAARLTSLDLTVTRGLIASHGWIGGDLATTLLDEIERLTAALAHQRVIPEDCEARTQGGAGRCIEPATFGGLCDHHQRVARRIAGGA